MRNDRIIIGKFLENFTWFVVSNPKVDYFTKAMNVLLCNYCNDYAEYRNGITQTRMIRLNDIEKYGIKFDDLKEEYILKQKDFKETTND